MMFCGDMARICTGIQFYQQKKFINKPVIKKPVKSKFAAFKASMKSSAPAQTIEHDWGLFKVTSPIRKPTYHCEGIHVNKDISILNSVIDFYDKIWGQKCVFTVSQLTLIFIPCLLYCFITLLTFQIHQI